MSKTAYPLSWPEGWKRTPPGNRKRGQFNRKERVSNPQNPQSGSWMKTKDLSIYDGLTRVLSELQCMGVGRDDIILSTNVPTRLDGLPRSDAREPQDPGAAVYWQERGQPMRCMAVDRYDRVADNLAAIAATLEAMRAIERHGGAEILSRAFTGFAALPEKASQSWRAVFGFKEGERVTAAQVNDAFRRLAHTHHPDKGGDSEKWLELTMARDNAMRDVEGAA
jgi:hypothetical protein